MPRKFPSESLIHHLAVIDDPRMDRTKEHLLIDILMIAVCAMLCGAESFVEFEQFGNAKFEFLRGLLELPNGIPSHDTFRRVFCLLDPKQFSECFRHWTEGLRRAFSKEIVAIDGKTLRRSHDRANGKEAIHMVSAWARENSLVLGQIKVDDKSNEITAIPELLRVLNLKGCIVTIDAMGCQKQIASEISAAQADYVLALKGNQTTMHEEVQEFMEAAHAAGFPEIAHDFLEVIERDDIAWLTQYSQWKGLRSAAMVESIREIQGKVTTERRFYISSLAANARQVARAVRGHWSVENNLHWSLDVSFAEDQCRARAGYSPENLAVLRHIAVNILKADKSKKLSIKTKQKCASWDHPYLLKLLQI
jgi:predicted transposase YbfD/YdcC